MGRWLVAMLLAAALAGCTKSSAPEGDEFPSLDFAPMSLSTVPLEPWEARGIIEVAWNGQRMGVTTRGEGGMPAQAILDGSTMYTTQFGMGWTLWSTPVYVKEFDRGFRYLAWNVPDLLSHGKFVASSANQFTAKSSYASSQGEVQVELEIRHVGPRIQEIKISTPQDPESPFTLVPSGHAFGFAIETPTKVRVRNDIVTLDGQARAGHVKILQWIEQYRSQVGSMPAEPTPENLAIQRLNQPWPTSPYDGKAMKNQVQSGHFEWSRCSDRDASYRGLGWDGAPISQDFGLGCAA